MPSFESRVVELFLRVTDRKKRDGLHRFIDCMVSPKPPHKMHAKYGIKESEVGGQNIFTLSPEGRTSEHHILYLHGGAYIKSFCKQHWRFLGKLIDELDCTITAPDYPLAPRHTHKDAFAMVLPLYKKLVEEEVEAANLTVMGDSAGGGMGLALAKKLRDEGKLEQPQNIILLSPWLDVTMRNPEIAEVEKKDPMLGVPGLIAAGRSYAGDTDPSNYLISPINGSLKGLGHITLFIGTHDVFIADCRKLRGQAEREDVSICYCEGKDMMHVWMLFSFPESKEATKQIIGIINREGCNRSGNSELNFN